MPCIVNPSPIGKRIICWRDSDDRRRDREREERREEDRRARQRERDAAAARRAAAAAAAAARLRRKGSDKKPNPPLLPPKTGRKAAGTAAVASKSRRRYAGPGILSGRSDYAKATKKAAKGIARAGGAVLKAVGRIARLRRANLACQRLAYRRILYYLAMDYLNREAHARCPVVTGRLRSSLQVRGRRPNIFSLEVTSGLPYFEVIARDSGFVQDAWQALRSELPDLRIRAAAEAKAFCR